MGKNGEYTRIKGLPRDKKYKTLLLHHIENCGKGCLKEFTNVLPDLPKSTVLAILCELREEKKVEFKGSYIDMVIG
ncbi:MAG: hypothetical protein LBN19_02210 [Endomicrobium sp.]|jgi:hypothetical protein|nr:hypothetical protein [Endomicrobium sp.]